MRKSLVLIAAISMLVAASSAFAGPTAGQLALGSSDLSETPIGIRYWASQKVAIDAEAGFWIYDVESGSGDLSSAFHLLFGIPVFVWECSDVWLHFRPFFALDAHSFEDIDTDGDGDIDVDGESLMDFAIGAEFEAELWLLECLSFSVRHGIHAQINDGGEGGDSTTDFHSHGASLGDAGFHLYF
ncbi:MAG: hypothetical protein ACT4PE_07095 [Candidatus Eiseniibacteriota bacterium]